MASDNRSTRGRFLVGAAGAGVAVVGGATAATKSTSGTSVGRSAYPIPGAVYPDPDLAWGDPFKQPILGRLSRVNGREIELRENGKLLRITVPPTASIYTDSQAGLEDFFAGELVAVEGADQEGGVLEASAVWSAVTSVWTRILAVNGNVVDTEYGRILLTPRTRYQDAKQTDARMEPRNLEASLVILAELRTAPGRAAVASVVKVL